MEEKRKYLEYFDGAFDSTVAEKRQPEKWPYVAYSKEEGVVYTIIPKEEGTMYTIYRVVKKDISNCTYNMVDLGLSVKWADRNVGATSPEHYGSYFQWGEIVRNEEGKPTSNAYTFDGAREVTAAEMASLLQPFVGDEIVVTKDNVGEILEKMGLTDTDLTPMGTGGVLGKEFNWDSYFDTTDRGNTFNTYNNNEGLTVLESSDDAATVHMGSQYRMPTVDEIRELMNNTTQTFIDLDGKEYDRQYVYDNKPIERGKLKGVKFTGSNGNSIFIPAAGSCNGSLLYDIGMGSKLWSSSLYDGSDDGARHLDFYYDGYINEYGYSRFYGLSVRGVQP